MFCNYVFRIWHFSCKARREVLRSVLFFPFDTIFRSAVNQTHDTSCSTFSPLSIVYRYKLLRFKQSEKRPRDYERLFNKMGFLVLLSQSLQVLINLFCRKLRSDIGVTLVNF